eukprot:tig00020849_g14637.t1
MHTTGSNRRTRTTSFVVAAAPADARSALIGGGAASWRRGSSALCLRKAPERLTTRALTISNKARVASSPERHPERRRDHQSSWFGLWAARRFQHNAACVASPKDVQAVLASPQSAGLGPYAFQPLVASSKLIDAETHTYSVEERIPLGPFRIPNRFRARIEPHSDGRGYSVECWAFGGVYLEGTLRWNGSKSGAVRVYEKASIHGPFFCIDLIARTASAAHAEMIKRIASAASAAARDKSSAAWL